MAIHKTKIRKNFTQISNDIFKDNSLSMKEKGLYCTLCSLPDGWDFSVEGLAALFADGKDSIRNALTKLEAVGYIARIKSRDDKGCFESTIEILSKKASASGTPSRASHDGKPVTENPSRENHHGSSVTENPAQYNTDESNTNTNNIDTISINQSPKVTDGQTDDYKLIVANHIKLDQLLKEASAKDESYTQIVNNVFDTICDTVCYPPDSINIRGTVRPGEVVKSQFLKLSYDNVVAVADRILNTDTEITNLHQYMISSLYSESLAGSLEAHNKSSSSALSVQSPRVKSNITESHKHNNEYMQRTYSDADIAALERKKLGIPDTVSDSA